ncbi:acyl-CoA dehydrogenase family protein [Streptomyces sp. bgisy034]|uniref:acyl-CoA dehydrogenase family protein n=1 Tax=Streptomyces sp. bgisy034 TaxID=3413774 RepID=UPI003EBE246B
MRDDTFTAVDALIADLAKGRPNETAGDLPDLWPTMVELGLSTVGVDETAGGSGGSLSDAVDLARSLGRHAIGSPLIEHATARWALGESGAGTEGLVTLAFTDGDLSGPDSVRVLLHAVPWARHARYLLVAGAYSAAVVDLRHPGVTIEQSVNEAGEPRDYVGLDGVAASFPESWPGGVAVRNRLGALWAAALAGGVEGTYRLTRRYVNEREQFGAALIRIPGVANHLATIKAELIQVEAALHRAQHAVHREVDTDRATASVATARVVAARAATTTARLGHQLHGAMGLTAEYPLHRHTTRLWAWRDEGTPEHEWSLRLGDLACAQGEEGVWQLLTG